MMPVEATNAEGKSLALQLWEAKNGPLPDYVQRRQREGVKMGAIATEVGCSTATLWRWINACGGQKGKWVFSNAKTAGLPLASLTTAE